MKKLFLFFTLISFFVLSSCGSTQNCRTRTTAQNIKNIQTNTVSVVSADVNK